MVPAPASRAAPTARAFARISVRPRRPSSAESPSRTRARGASVPGSARSVPRERSAPTGAAVAHAPWSRPSPAATRSPTRSTPAARPVACVTVSESCVAAARAASWAPRARAFAAASAPIRRACPAARPCPTCSIRAAPSAAGAPRATGRCARRARPARAVRPVCAAIRARAPPTSPARRPSRIRPVTSARAGGRAVIRGAPASTRRAPRATTNGSAAISARRSAAFLAARRCLPCSPPTDGSVGPAATARCVPPASAVPRAFAVRRPAPRRPRAHAAA